MAGDVVLWFICFFAVASLLGILVYQVYFSSLSLSSHQVLKYCLDDAFIV
jgi:hypothetical protein